ncbi:hypothetical protein EDB83DRAFT_2313782 [Lactarius deliciosus]|nr:hypothetical protein EDB83DRAFT_2313782 [Lactarius deliciosus]
MGSKNILRVASGGVRTGAGNLDIFKGIKGRWAEQWEWDVDGQRGHEAWGHVACLRVSMSRLQGDWRWRPWVRGGRRWRGSNKQEERVRLSHVMPDRDRKDRKQTILGPEPKPSLQRAGSTLSGGAIQPHLQNIESSLHQCDGQGDTQGVADVGKTEDSDGEVEYDEGEVGHGHNL